MTSDCCILVDSITQGRMLLLATGSLLVMVDLDTEGKPVPQNGLFRAFRSVTSLGKFFSHFIFISWLSFYIVFCILYYFDVLCCPGSSAAQLERELGFKQSFLRGHSNPIGLIEVCTFCNYKFQQIMFIFYNSVHSTSKLQCAF